MRAVVITFCLFGALSCYAVPTAMSRAGEATDKDVSASASMQAHLPSLTSSLSSAANALPIKPPTTVDLNKRPLKLPTQIQTFPVLPSAVEGIPSAVASYVADPTKLIPGIKELLPFNPVASGISFVRPIVKLPFVVVDNAYDIPLQAWDSAKNIVDATVHIPKEEISAAQQAVDSILDGLSG
ncbi:uncharacterized protein LOC124158813 [Ischnura elegans]|uniref:uncharacterized protein LOC124158813 n=1 Tax=Ischnura elegans TaxID=197161 RepID=UPI001ED8AE24|nr:uncharacterized protein LOC124158813 [Ischnura elegans]